MRQDNAGTWGFSDLTRITVLEYAVHGIGMLCNLVLTPILFRKLGVDDYGLWLILLSMVGLLYVLELGLGDNIVRAVTRHRASGNLEAARPVVANGVVLALAIAGATSLVILLGQGVITRWIDLTPDQEELVRPLIVVGLVLFSTGLLAGVADAVLISTRHFAHSYAIEIAEVVSTSGLTWLVLLLGHGLLAVAIVNAATQCASTVVKFVATRLTAPELPLSPLGARWTRAAWQPLVQPMAWTSLIMLAGVIGFDADDLILGSIISTGAVATVTVAFRIPSILMNFAQTAFSAVFPYSADMSGRSDPGAIARVLIYGTRFALMLTMLSLIAFWYAGPLLLELWVGPVEDGAMLLRLGLVMNVVFNGFVVVELVLYGLGEMRALAIISLLASLVNLPVTIVLTYRIGLAGPLIGTIAGGIVIAILSVERAAQLIESSARAFCQEAVIWPIAAMAPAVLAVFIARTLTSDGDAQALGATGMAMAVYLTAVLIKGFSEEERERGLAFVQLAVRRLAPRW
jgi:O-antigen/teichoic acid export membrane protein